MEETSCPHCAARNPADASFCGACGKALPGSATSAPRIVASGDHPSTASGLDLQSKALAAKTQKASGALLLVAILQAVFGTIILASAGAGRDVLGVQVSTAVYVAVYGLAAVFFALYLWARKNPLPAAIAGLVIFVTVHLLDAVANPRTLMNGILVKVLVIAILVKAIQAGIQHRKLLRESPRFADRP